MGEIVTEALEGESKKGGRREEEGRKKEAGGEKGFRRRDGGHLTCSWFVENDDLAALRAGPWWHGEYFSRNAIYFRNFANRMPFHGMTRNYMSIVKISVENGMEN